MTIARPDASSGEEPFILTAMVSLLGATLWMWVRHDLFLQYFYMSDFLALTHLVTLGFITSLMMGVLIRLAPMSLGVEPRSTKLARLQFVLFFIGSLGMISHFWLSSFPGMAWSTLLLLAAGLTQLLNFRGVFHAARRGSWPARYVASSLVYFVAAALLGVLLGIAKGFDVSLLGPSYLSNVFSHVHLAALGWVTTMIFGFELKLLPTTAGDPRWWPVRFWLLQAGIVGLSASFLADVSGKTLWGGLIAATIVWQVWGPTRAWLRGRARDWEAVPLWFLVLGAGLGVSLSFGFPAVASPLHARVQLAYGYTGILGWIVLTIMAVAFKLFPVWVWQERFKKDFGKKPVPGMKELYDHRLRAVSHVLVALGVSGTIAGILLASRPMLFVATGFMFLGTVAFVVNFVRMARWALLRLEFRPGESDWKKFREMFPGRGGSSDGPAVP